ncbi:MAG: hypothetical protein R2794_13665 [Chitinophagales bacterium]
MIELFEKCLQEDAYHFFDEGSYRAYALEYYEMQNNLERAEAVDYAISRNPSRPIFWCAKLNLS